MQYYQYMWDERSGVLGSLIDLVGEGSHTEVTKKKDSKKNKFYWEPVHQQAFEKNEATYYP